MVYVAVTQELQSTGFDIVGSPQPLGELPQVQNLRIEASSVEGHLRARWKRVAGARNYVLDQAANPEGPWALGVATTTRTSHTFTGLTPGAKYWFRARAFGTSGFGGWSDPACKIAA